MPSLCCYVSRLQGLGAALEAVKGIEGPDMVILDADDCYEVRLRDPLLHPFGIS